MVSKFKLKQLFYKLTGGRPMVLLGDILPFYDNVQNKEVKFYKDKHKGNQWMAVEGPWSWFRVKCDK